MIAIDLAQAALYNFILVVILNKIRLFPTSFLDGDMKRVGCYKLLHSALGLAGSFNKGNSNPWPL
jgi:hypothetical protein